MSSVVSFLKNILTVKAACAGEWKPKPCNNCDKSVDWHRKHIPCNNGHHGLGGSYQTLVQCGKCGASYRVTYLSSKSRCRRCGSDWLSSIVD